MWTGRMEDISQPFEYRTALRECIDDLNQLINKAIEEDFDYQQMLEEQYADSYLASMEAHEAAV